MIARIRFACVIGLICIATLFLLPLQLLAIHADWQLARKIPMLWHQIAARALGFRVRKIGLPTGSRPLLLVANHLSWSDIVVLGSLAEVSFIAKSEVSDIPFAGLLARLQRTVFVVRQDRRGVPGQTADVASRLISGDVLVLFAEGTTGFGNEVLTFKSALFGAAGLVVKDDPSSSVSVQPVSIAYTHCRGLRMGRRERSVVTWPGELELGPHVRDILDKGPWDVDVTFCEPLVFGRNSKRQVIAAEARRRIVKAYMASIAD